MGIQAIDIEDAEPSANHDLNNNQSRSKNDKFTKNELVFIVQIYTVDFLFNLSFNSFSRYQILKSML